jgi:hypothetical protein
METQQLVTPREGQAHWSVLVQDVLTKDNVTKLQCLQYSPDIAATDFYMFLRLKSALKGQHFCHDTDIFRNETEELRRLSQNGFQECFRHIYSL